MSLFKGVTWWTRIAPRDASTLLYYSKSVLHNSHRRQEACSRLLHHMNQAHKYLRNSPAPPRWQHQHCININIKILYKSTGFTERHWGNRNVAQFPTQSATTCLLFDICFPFFPLSLKANKTKEAQRFMLQLHFWALKLETPSLNVL